MCEGVVGTRLKPSTAKLLRADTGQDIDLEDEAAFDPEDIEALLGYDMPALLVPPTQVQDIPDIGKTVSFEATDIYSGCFYGLCRGD